MYAIHWHSKHNGTAYILYYYSRILNFSPFCSPGNVLICRPFWDKRTESFQSDSEHYKVKGTPYMCYNIPEFQNFSNFRSITSRLRVMGHLETSEPNDLQITRTRSKVHHICVTSVPASQISARCSAEWPVSEWCWTLHCQKPRVH